MSARGIVAVVPMKPLHLAKSRLAAALTANERAAMSLSMLGRVVRAALESDACQVWVVGGDSEIERSVADLGAAWYEETGADLNETVSAAFHTAFAKDMVPMYLAADLPFVTSDDVSGLIEASSYGRKLTLSPAHRDGGTNAIVVPLDSKLRPVLGRDSFQRHKDQATTLGEYPTIYDCPGLGLDLDTLEDLRVFQEIEPGILDRLIGDSSRSTRAVRFHRNR